MKHEVHDIIIIWEDYEEFFNQPKYKPEIDKIKAMEYAWLEKVGHDIHLNDDGENFEMQYDNKAFKDRIHEAEKIDAYKNKFLAGHPNFREYLEEEYIPDL